MSSHQVSSSLEGRGKEMGKCPPLWRFKWRSFIIFDEKWVEFPRKCCSCGCVRSLTSSTGQRFRKNYIAFISLNFDGIYNRKGAERDGELISIRNINIKFYSISIAIHWIFNGNIHGFSAISRSPLFRHQFGASIPCSPFAVFWSTPRQELWSHCNGRQGIAGTMSLQTPYTVKVPWRSRIN